MKAKANICNNTTAALLQSIIDSPLFSTYKELKDSGWKVQAVDQQRGRCYYTDKTITIPIWAYHSTRINYWIWYVAHEFAHTYAKGDSHGQKFMAELKRICPVECVHYELGYMQQSASAAGITISTAGKEEIAEKKSVNVNSLLGDW